MDKSPDRIKDLKRVVIEHFYPEINGGAFPAKRVPGEPVRIEADIYSEGHDSVSALVLSRKCGDSNWQKGAMTSLGNDRWEGTFIVQDAAGYEYSCQAWVNHFETWQKDFQKKVNAEQDVKTDILVGIRHLENLIGKGVTEEAKALKELLSPIKKQRKPEKRTELLLDEKLLALSRAIPDTNSLIEYDKTLKVVIDRTKALYSTWYEFFPRSFGPNGEHGTFKDCEKILPRIAEMGFDVVYLPPIHPIGKTHRKGKNNARIGTPDDPGSPWAIGSIDGGHKAIHPQLGTMKDFQNFVKKAGSLGMEVALDIAFQCSPDHPYVKEHPEWFFMRPDGTIQYAENPPKKYEDIYPINFHCENYTELWAELKSVFDFWIEKGIKIFRVDNPHTKPFAFWEWLIAGIRKDNPDVIFLAEAFTRPKVMQQLAKVGFQQSYTYFTWRPTKWDLTQYMTELTQTEMREFFRPNFWPNTPDILAYHLQSGGRPAFISRFVLAATLSSNYGIYGPAFETCENQAIAGKEEYYNSEKYELKQWDWNIPGNIKDIITRVNKVRKDNPALQTTWNVEFCEIPNDQIISYYKATPDFKNIILVVVNLDPVSTQSGWVKLPLGKWGIDANEPFKLLDLITRDAYTWQGEWNFVELNPYKIPVHVFLVNKP